MYMYDFDIAIHRRTRVFREVARKEKGLRTKSLGRASARGDNKSAGSG